MRAEEWERRLVELDSRHDWAGRVLVVARPDGVEVGLARRPSEMCRLVMEAFAEDLDGGEVLLRWQP